MDQGFAFIDRTEPDSPTSTTPTATSFPRATATPSDDPSSQLKQLGRQVYKEVWNEFYDWEPGYCAEILGTVTQSILASKRQVGRVAKATVAQLVDAPDTRIPRTWTADGTDVMVMSITHFDAPSGHHRRVQTRTTEVSIPVITINAYRPHPKYESCPPASRSVLMDTFHEDTLSFLPYADEEQFPALEYQAKFGDLDWETPFDPDGKLACLRARCDK